MPGKNLISCSHPSDKSLCADDNRYWLVYDGQCPLCLRSVAWVRRADRTGKIVLLDLHLETDRIRRRAPQLSREELLTQLHLIGPDCTVWTGFEALRKLSTLLPMLWPTAPLLHLPGSGSIGRMLYHWTSRNRYRLSGCSPSAGCSGAVASRSCASKPASSSDAGSTAS